jgi:hypothetical protein
MLNTNALDSSLTLTERYDAQGIVVKPIAGTPLEILVNHCALHQFAVSTSTGQHLSSSEISELTARPSSVSGYSAHELDMKELTEKVSDSVRNHLKFARTVVAPDVAGFVEALTPAIEELSRNPLHEIEVVVNDSYGFLYEPELTSSIDRSKEIPVIDVRMNFRHEARSDDQVLDMMSTGSASLDQAVALFVSKLPSGRLSQIWTEMFTQLPQDSSVEAQSFQQLLSEAGHGAARALVTYLVARKLWNNPADDSNMTAREYEDLMVDFRDQAALALLRERYRQDLAAQSGLLVESCRYGKIVVNNNVYKEWTRNGGNNEVLLGLSLSSNPAQRVEVINENSESYKQAWNKHVVLSQSVIRNRRFERTKDLLEAEFQHYLLNVPESELCLGDREDVKKRFQHALGQTKLEECDPENLYSLVLRLLCKSRYHYTDARFILSTVERVSKENPGMDVREAASIATIEYVARWVGSQMKLDSART